jgi:6-pyruvoyltetrahydropterin/6-carboxytetrahydropterin synthase
MSTLAYTTRRFIFAAGHRYWVPTWSPERNQEVFGRLTVPHGHTYTLEVTVRGPVDPDTGMVMDLGELKRIVQEVVVDRFDHALLNDDPLFHRRVPTAEHLAMAVWALLAPKLGGERLWRVRIWEDPTLYVDYYGP